MTPDPPKPSGRPGERTVAAALAAEETARASVLAAADDLTDLAASITWLDAGRPFLGVDPARLYTATADWLASIAEAMESGRMSGNMLLSDVGMREALEANGVRASTSEQAVRLVAGFCLAAAAVDDRAPGLCLLPHQLTDPDLSESAAVAVRFAEDICRNALLSSVSDAPAADDAASPAAP